MAQTATPKELRDRVSNLLRTRTAGHAVAEELSSRYREWQDRAVIGHLRLGRLQDRYDDEVISHEATARDMLLMIAGRRH